MRITAHRLSLFVGFVCIVASMAACGGTKPEAKAPGAAEVSTPQSGTASLDPSGTIDKSPKTESAPASATASASTKDDGSDIIPPFTAGAKDKDSAKPTKTAKTDKKSRKPKKKG